MCLVGATYLFEDNRKGLGEGVAGVCGEGWEGRFLSGCREKRCGRLLKDHPWPGAWAPREGGVTSQKVTRCGRMGRRAQPRDLSATERRALQNLLSVLCVLPHLLPIFPGLGEGEVPACTFLQSVPRPQ